MLDLDGLLDELTGTLAEAAPALAARDVVARVVDRPGAVTDALAPRTGGLRFLLQRPDLTVINASWAPGMRLMPHDHRMWAVIGIYQGAEENEFFRRAAGGRLEERGGRRLDVGDVLVLGDDAVHAVANPTTVLTGAIHVYGGDFAGTARSQWGPGDLVERPFDLTEVERQFAAANRAAGLDPT